jgi:transcriptional regulator with XRE-family HTH domain
MTRIAHQLIKARREALGLSDVQVGERTGLSVYEYGDIEQYADEIFSVTDLRQVRVLCQVLGIDLFELFDLTCEFCGQNQLSTDYLLPRNELVRKQRLALGMSEEQLGDDIGFEARTVQYLEEDKDHLEGWSYELIEELAKLLKLPVQILLGVKCPICKR